MLGALRVGKLGDFWKRELLRMPPMDLADIAYDRFLANGEPEHRIAAKPCPELARADRRWLRVHVFLPPVCRWTLTIVAADGQDVVPVKKDRVLIGVAETSRRACAGARRSRVLTSCAPPHRTAQLGLPSGSVTANAIRLRVCSRRTFTTVLGKLKPSNIFALTPGGTMGMPTREVNAGKFDKPGVMGGMMTMEEMMGMKMADMPMDAGMSMGGGMKGMDHGATKMDGIDRVGITGESAPPAIRATARNAWDYVPFGPDIASRKPLVMDGMDKRPGPPYQDLRSTKNTGLPTRILRGKLRLTPMVTWSATFGRSTTRRSSQAIRSRSAAARMYASS